MHKKSIFNRFYPAKDAFKKGILRIEINQFAEFLLTIKSIY